MAEDKQTYNISGGTADYSHQHIGENARVHNGPVYGGVVNNFHGQDTNEDFRQASQRDKIRKAIFETDPVTDRANLIRNKGQRTPGTCSWILEDKTFQAWQLGEFPVLCVRGGPGKGKTMLADYVVEELNRNAVTLMYFFCLSNDSKRNNLVSILRGWIYQLLLKEPVVCDTIAQYFEAEERTPAVVTSIDTLWTMLETLVENSKKGIITCLVDGLDECTLETRVSLSKLLAKHAKSSNACKMRFLIFSRNLPSMARFAQLQLDPDNDIKINNDVARYIQERVSVLADLVDLDAKTTKTIQGELAKRSEGTFLWVGFVVQELEKQSTRSLLLDTLSDMPTGLPALYQRMLRQIPASRKTRCLDILRWVTLAARPLTCLEISGVLIPSLRGRPSHAQELEVLDAIKECGGIIALHAEPQGRARPDDEDDQQSMWSFPLISDLSGSGIHDRRFDKQYLSLVHQSARDYLLRGERDETVSSEDFHVSAGRDHAVVMHTCVDRIESSLFGRYACASDLQWWSSATSTSIYDLDGLQASEVESPLLRYAVRHWLHHARSTPTAMWHAEECAFLSAAPSLARANWARASLSSWGDRWGYSLPFVAIASGSQPWLSYLLDNDKISLDHEGTAGITLLMAAVMRGRSDIVKLLVDSGADVKSTCNALMAHGTAVDYVFEGVPPHDKKVLTLLIESGADVNIEEDRRSPLDMAIDHAWTEGVQILLAAGANVHHLSLVQFEEPLIPTYAEEYRSWQLRLFTPLGHAFTCTKFKIEIVLDLLRAGASLVVADGKFYSNAFRHVIRDAASVGYQKSHEEVLELLFRDRDAYRCVLPRQELEVLGDSGRVDCDSFCRSDNGKRILSLHLDLDMDAEYYIVRGSNIDPYSLNNPYLSLRLMH